MAEKLSIEAELAQSTARVKEVLAKARPKMYVGEAEPEAPAPAVDADEATAEAEVAPEPEAVAEAPEGGDEAEVEQETDKRFTMLAEREVKLRGLEKELKDKESNLGKSVDHLKEEIRAEYRRLVQEDTQGFFDDVKLNYEEISKKMLEKRPDPTALKLKKEVGELQKKLQAQEVRETEAKNAKLREAAQAEVRAWVDKSEAHPLTKAAGWHDRVLEEIQIHYSETGQVLSEDAAADRVEAFLSDLTEKLGKGKAKPEPAKQSPKKPATPTLKNKQAAATPTRGNGPEPLLSKAESIARAAKLIKFLPQQE